MKRYFVCSRHFNQMWPTIAKDGEIGKPYDCCEPRERWMADCLPEGVPPPVPDLFSRQNGGCGYRLIFQKDEGREDPRYRTQHLCHISAFEVTYKDGGKVLVYRFAEEGQLTPFDIYGKTLCEPCKGEGKYDHDSYYCVVFKD